MKGLFTLIALSLLVGTATMGQLNTASPLYLSILAGSISYGDESPYAIPKKIAANEDLFRESENAKYKSSNYGDAEFAVFEHRKGKYEAFQILSIQPSFTLLCEHYVEETCDCFEGLHILHAERAEPQRVRRIWPFSLKTNLVDEISSANDAEFKVGDFQNVCEILEFLEKP